jgi:hypothetical protein
MQEWVPEWYFEVAKLSKTAQEAHPMSLLELFYALRRMNVCAEETRKNKDYGGLHYFHPREDP